MDNENKVLYLNALNGTATLMDKLGLIEVSNLVYAFEDIVFNNATTSNGELTLNGDGVNDYVEFENTSGSSISVIGVGLYSSGAKTLTAGSTTNSDAVVVDSFGSTITLDPGERLRIEIANYTIN